MQEPRHRTGGYSLVELLIVMSILALLAGVAIPTIARVGGFLSNDPDLAARELYSSLRAARVYATTYRVDTALVYGYSARTDSATNVQVPIFDSYGMARKMSREEAKDLLLTPAEENIAYVLVQERDAHFRKMPASACVLSIDNAYDPPLGVFADGSKPEEGLQGILVFDGDGSLITPIKTISSDPADARLPAHVFAPSGFMEPQTSLVARFTVNVGPTPDSSLEDRFTVAPDEDPGNPAGLRKVPVRIELFRTTGRVKMTS